MRIKDYVERDWILVHLEPPDKAGLFEQLAAEIAARVPQLDREDLLGRLLEREQQASTGLGNGVAIPHTTLDGLERVRVLLAVIPAGVEYEAIDGKPVHVVWVLLGPRRSVGDHLKLLARIARLIRREAFVQELRSAGSADEAFELVVQEDERHVE